jgi:hypothetical protein
MDTNTKSMRMGTSGTTRSLGLSLTAKNVSTLVVDDVVVVVGIRAVVELLVTVMEAVVELDFLVRRTTQPARLHPCLLVRVMTAGSSAIIKGRHCVLDSLLHLRQVLCRMSVRESCSSTCCDSHRQLRCRAQSRRYRSRPSASSCGPFLGPARVWYRNGFSSRPHLLSTRLYDSG